MCGIVGFMTGPNPTANRWERQKVLSQLLFVDTLRGAGGTGIATVDKDNNVSVYKRGLAAPDFLQVLMGEMAIKSAEDAHIVIGHNRAPTAGTVSDKNAHPFHFAAKQEIVLVHNGTLNGYYGLSPSSFQHSVDSAHVAIAMAGTDDELSVLKKLKGSFVLVWYNKTKRTFNVARNTNRDIWYKIVDDGTFWFASEMNALDWILVRNGVKITADKRGVRDYRNFSEDCWYEWKLDDKWNFGKPTTRKIVYEKEERGSYYNTRGESAYPLWNDYHEHDVEDTKDRAANWHRRHRNGSERPLPHNGAKWDDPQNAAILSKFGLKRKDLIFADIDIWEPYSRSEQGKLYGDMVGWYNSDMAIPEATVTVHGVHRSVWTRIVTEKMRYYLPVRVSTYQGYKSISGEKSIDLICDIDWNEFNIMSNAPAKYLSEKGAILEDLTAELAIKGAKHKEEENSVEGPGGVLIPHSFWKELTAEGCAWCSDAIEDRDYHEIKWIEPISSSGERSPLCHKCSVNDSVNKEIQSFGLIPFQPPEDEKEAS